MISIRFVSAILLTFTFLSCGPSREEEAAEKLQEAMVLRDSGRFNQARLKLDTVISNYGDLTQQVADAMRLLDTIKLKEQHRNLVYLDSMIVVKKKELEPLMKSFIKSTEYGSDTILIHYRQRPENSYNRTFIRAHLNTKGEFYISSRYHGNKWIRHNRIKVYNAGESVTSEVVEADDLENRCFEDGEHKWEIVSYKNGADNGIIDFIASNVDEPLKVQFMGDDYYYIVMEQFDKEAIRDGYETSFVLQELTGLREERRKVLREIERLEK